ncbi:recombination protein NinG [Serratia bockelmannii]|uniref:recombination protein NinG n=1 Tax=Serratia bockelmannii TaxID=2703793 RepID=UPI003FA7A999
MSKADYAVMLVGKQREQRVKAQQRTLDKARKEERKQLRARKQALKTKPKWKAEAQVAFNRYVRIRDAGKLFYTGRNNTVSVLGRYMQNQYAPWLTRDQVDDRVRWCIEIFNSAVFVAVRAAICIESEGKCKK